jgi:prepilin-type N-terminal cleavage/methylation domain-containing protein
MKVRQRGFTLIELVLVLGITGAVAASVMMVTTTLLLNHKKPNTQQIILQQAQYAGFQMPRDIQMSNNVTLGSLNGFPVVINIAVDQDQNHNYRVEYVLDGDKMKRRQFDISDNLIAENTISQYVDTGNTSVENPSEDLYRLNIRVSRDEESVSAYYLALRRLIIR